MVTGNDNGYRNCSEQPVGWDDYWGNRFWSDHWCSGSHNLKSAGLGNKDRGHCAGGLESFQHRWAGPQELQIRSTELDGEFCATTSFTSLVKCSQFGPSLRFSAHGWFWEKSKFCTLKAAFFHATPTTSDSIVGNPQKSLSNIIVGVGHENWGCAILTLGVRSLFGPQIRWWDALMSICGLFKCWSSEAADMQQNNYKFAYFPSKMYANCHHRRWSGGLFVGAWSRMSPGKLWVVESRDHTIHSALGPALAVSTVGKWWARKAMHHVFMVGGPLGFSTPASMVIPIYLVL